VDIWPARAVTCQTAVHPFIRCALAVKPARNPIASSTKHFNTSAAWIVPGFTRRDLCKRGHERMGTQATTRRFAGPCFYGSLAYIFSSNSVQLNPRLQDNPKRRSVGAPFTDDAVHRAQPLLVQMCNISDWIRSHRSRLEALAWLIAVVGISLVLLLFVFGPGAHRPYRAWHPDIWEGIHL
jgi:hypothetical protein